MTQLKITLTHTHKSSHPSQSLETQLPVFEDNGSASTGTYENNKIITCYTTGLVTRQITAPQSIRLKNKLIDFLDTYSPKVQLNFEPLYLNN